MSVIGQLPEERCGERTWRMTRSVVSVGGARVALRLTRFAAGWVASADSLDGPTLGVDHSPYLATWRALEPLGLTMTEAMALVSTADARS